MTETELELYRKLAETEASKRVFGRWRYADRYFCSRQAEYGLDGIKWIERVECINGKLQHIDPEPCCPDVALWLPPVFDPGQPGRCLWGMVDWRRMWISVRAGGDLSGETLPRKGRMVQLEPGRADLVLARAIIIQETGDGGQIHK